MNAPDKAHRVTIIDDHELIRQGLARAFERQPDFELVGSAGTLADGLRLVAELKPDVIVTDVRLPDGTGLDLVKKVRERDDSVGIVVLTMYAGDEQLFGALEAGASAFVSKDAPAEDVISAARHAVVSPRSFSAADLGDAMKRRMEPGHPVLTARESEVLALLADGLNVSTIASRLFVSESTVKTHVSRIYEKLGAANRAQALMTAIKMGLIQGSPSA